MKDILEFRDFQYASLFECTKIMKKNYPDTKEGYWFDLFIKDITDTLNKEQFYERNCRVALYNRKIIGFGCYKKSVISTNIWELYWINISPNFQRKGMGSHLINDLEKDICKQQTNSEGNMILFVTDKPEFYKKLGYKSIYKQDEESIMIKYLSMMDCFSLVASKRQRLTHAH